MENEPAKTTILLQASTFPTVVVYVMDIFRRVTVILSPSCPVCLYNKCNITVIDSFTCLQASTFPTVVVYVMDTSHSVNPVTVMSNIGLYNTCNTKNV